LQQQQQYVKMFLMNDPVGLRARKKRETQKRIESSAFQLFEQSSFDHVTVESIAALADIAPRTFFSYFQTKEDVVLADYTSRLERIVEHLAERPATEAPWAALGASFMVVAADYDNERAQLARRFRIMATTPSVYARSLQLQAGWEDNLAAALAQRMGCDASSLGPGLLASSALSAMRSSQRHWITTGQSDPLPALVKRAFNQLGSGLNSV
jgi:AcrR family transcriptional regulator